MRTGTVSPTRSTMGKITGPIARLIAIGHAQAAQCAAGSFRRRSAAVAAPAMSATAIAAGTPARCFTKSNVTSLKRNLSTNAPMRSHRQASVGPEHGVQPPKEHHRQRRIAGANASPVERRDDKRYEFHANSERKGRHGACRAPTSSSAIEITETHRPEHVDMGVPHFETRPADATSRPAPSHGSAPTGRSNQMSAAARIASQMNSAIFMAKTDSSTVVTSRKNSCAAGG